MPQIFKALITLTVWFLFVKGCISIAAGMYAVAAAGQATLVSVAECGVGVAALILAAVAAWLRKKLE